MSGAVNPDAMLFAVSGALFFCLARAFRRGLTRRLAAGIGAVAAVGLLTKLNFIGLLPGAFVGVVILSVRVARISKREACRRFALACGIAASPTVFVLAGTRSGLHVFTSTAHRFSHDGTIVAKVSYIWQLYLPRLPGMVNDFPGIFTTRQIWFNGFVGLYGFGDTSFPGWVYSIALVPAAAILCMVLAEVLRRRAALRSRAAEACTYVLMSAGTMIMLGVTSYALFPAVNAEFAHARYLLPLLALFGAILALAARGVGRRWGPAAGVLIVVLMLAHDIFSQLLVISHYYG
jgi:4-amino-4-deoxy-L-arabinose transferase-like glycosyltransferase